MVVGWKEERERKGHTCVPPGVNDSYAKIATIVLLSFSGAFKSCHYEVRWLL